MSGWFAQGMLNSTPDLDAALAELGTVGWELVGIIPGQTQTTQRGGAVAVETTHHEYYFKRPTTQEVHT